MTPIRYMEFPVRPVKQHTSPVVPHSTIQRSALVSDEAVPRRHFPKFDHDGKHRKCKRKGELEKQTGFTPNNKQKSVLTVQIIINKWQFRH